MIPRMDVRMIQLKLLCVATSILRCMLQKRDLLKVKMLSNGYLGRQRIVELISMKLIWEG